MRVRADEVQDPAQPARPVLMAVRLAVPVVMCMAMTVPARMAAPVLRLIVVCVPLTVLMTGCLIHAIHPAR